MMRILFAAVSILVAMNGMAAERHPSIVEEELVYSEAPFPSCHASTIVEAAPGVFLTAFFGGTDEGEKDVAIWLCRQENGKWSPPVEAARAEGVPCWNPVLFKKPNGEIVLFYKAGPNPREWSGLYKTSTDEGKTWSKETLLPAGILGPIRAKPMLLEDGTLLCGSSVESWKTWACWVEATKDWGKTWVKYGPIVNPEELEGIIQPTLFRDKEGNLRMLCRSTRRIGRICMAISKDEGKTWSDAKPTELPNPSAGIDVVNLKDGRLALIYNHTDNSRRLLNIAISEDGGDSWKRVVDLENQEGEYSYPAMIQSEDGMLHATYTWKREKIKHVVLDPAKLTDGDSEEGFQSLFNGKDLEGWTIQGLEKAGPKVADGVMVVGGFDYWAVITKDSFKNFVLRFDVKFDDSTERPSNSGILIHTAAKEIYKSAFEIQLESGNDEKLSKPEQKNGAIFGFVAPSSNPAKPIGQWNAVEIKYDAPKIWVKINGETVQDGVDISKIAGLKHKFDEGRIAIQRNDLKKTVFFKNIRVKKLPD